MESLARNKGAQASTRNKGKSRADRSPGPATMPQYPEPAPAQEADTVQMAYPVWQPSVPNFLEEMPQEAAEMVMPRADVTMIDPIYRTYENHLRGLQVTRSGYGNGGAVVEGAFDTFSDTSYAFSQQSSAFGGGNSDFG